MIGLPNLWPFPNKEFFRIIPNRMYQILIRMLFAPRIRDHGKRKSNAEHSRWCSSTKQCCTQQVMSLYPESSEHNRWWSCIQKMKNTTGPEPQLATYKKVLSKGYSCWVSATVNFQRLSLMHFSQLFPFFLILTDCEFKFGTFEVFRVNQRLMLYKPKARCLSIKRTKNLWCKGW